MDARTAEVALACNRGAALAEQGELRRAATLFRRAIRLDPNCASARCNLAELMLRQEKHKLGLVLARAAHVCAPEAPGTNYTLARALMANGFRFAAMRPLLVFLTSVEADDPLSSLTHNALEILERLRDETVLETR